MPDFTASPWQRMTIFVGLFLFTLGSHYFYNIELYLFQVLGVFLVLPLFKTKYFPDRKDQLYLLLTAFGYIFFLGVIFGSLSGSEYFTPAKLALLVFFLTWLAFSAVMFGGFPYAFQSALRQVIWVHIGFFVLQFGWYITTLQLLDFLEPLTGEPQRALGGSYEVALLPAFLRATGLYNEPGTYSTWMIVMLLIYKVNGKRLGLPANDRWLQVCGIGTVLLSFSAFGMVFSCLYILLALSEKKFSIKSVSLTLLLTSPLVIAGLEYLNQRLAVGSDGNGIGFRLQALQLFVEGMSPSSLFFGLGLFTDFFTKADAELVYMDVGLWFFSFAAIGIAGAMILLSYIAASAPRSAAVFTLLLVIFLSKFPLTNPLIWLVLCYFIWAKTTPAKQRAEEGLA